METRTYSFTTYWHLDAPIDIVWDAIMAVEDWPHWWKYVRRIVELQKGDKNGLGATRRYTWSSKLPYSLSFNMRVTQVNRPTFLEGVATGELNGTGRWRLKPEGETTRVEYEWTVRTEKPWMNILAPLMAPAFKWNHDQVMAEGGKGLAKHLGVRLLDFGELPTKQT